MMKKRILCLLAAFALMTMTVSATFYEVFDADSETGDDHVVINTVPAVQGMAVNAEAALVMEAGTGRVLFSQDGDKQLPFASTTKIMTALITLEQANLDIEFEVDAGAIQVEGSSMGLQEGDIVTLRTLAAGMLLPSGNDAANAAAVRVSGSIPAFVELMNQRAKELGMENTSFETPSGLDGDNHYSTAYDLALLAREAMRNAEFAAICSQYKLRVSYGNPPYDRWLTNHNKLLNYYEYTTGMKTGFTKKAGRCLVSTAVKDGVELICVTLDCPDDWTTHQKLMDYFFDRIQVEDLSGGIPQISIPVTGGIAEEVAGVKMETAQIAVPVEGPEVEYIVTVQPFLYAPVEAGQPVGNVRIMLEGEQVARLELVAGSDVELLHPYKESFSLIRWFKGIWEKITGNQNSR